MPYSTIGMSRVLWVLMKKPGNTFLLWLKGYINSVTVQKNVSWNYGTGWEEQWNCLRWNEG